MKRKGIIMLILLVSIFAPLNVYANTLTLNISVNKKEIKVGDEIEIKVSWDKEMQAADFYLNYDSNKLEYIKSNIDDIFINNDAEENLLKTAWVSMDNTDKTDIEYTFKVKRGGQAKITTITNGGFSTGKLEVPNAYNEGEIIMKISDNNKLICIVAFIIIALILIFIIKERRKFKEKNKKKS